MIEVTLVSQIELTLIKCRSIYVGDGETTTIIFSINITVLP